MATKTIVESPAGEQIEVLEDRVWTELTGSDIRGIRQFSGTKPWVLRALWEHGEFTDKSGLASKVMIDYINQHYPDAHSKAGALTGSGFSAMVTQAVALPAIERQIRGKRCYSIKLLGMPATWFQKLMKNLNEYPYAKAAERIEVTHSEPVAESVTVVPPEVEWNPATSEHEIVSEISDDDIQRFLDDVPGVDAPTIYEELPALDLNIATQVAMSLLTTCVEIITAGNTATVDERVRKLQGDYSDVAQKLSQRLAENDSLRRQLRNAGDEIRALRVERDGLRSRLRATEANLTAALKGDAVAAINGEIQRRVDQIMRIAPTKRGEE